MKIPKQAPKQNQDSQIIIYQTEDGKTKLDVRLEDETVWLTQKMMAELFQTTIPNVNMHLNSIFDDGELELEPTIKDFLIVQIEGERSVERTQKFYNLDAIISVGYRIKSHVATKFRQWATQRLKEFIIKGFVLDDGRLKNPDQPYDYFEELLRRLQDIRTSERRFYQKITDIYATSVDYDPTTEMSIEFFKTVQNKMHWAITGKTAAEIIYDRADSNKENMGLTTWRGARVRKQDTEIAKNYLNEEELLALNNLTEQYLVFAEGQAMRRIPMYMRDWLTKLHGFLVLNDRDILENAGNISHQLALDHAHKEYDRFNIKTIDENNAKGSDFDKFAKMLTESKKSNKSKKK